MPWKQWIRSYRSWFRQRPLDCRRSVLRGGYTTSVGYPWIEYFKWEENNILSLNQSLFLCFGFSNFDFYAFSKFAVVGKLVIAKLHCFTEGSSRIWWIWEAVWKISTGGRPCYCVGQNWTGVAGCCMWTVSSCFYKSNLELHLSVAFL